MNTTNWKTTLYGVASAFVGLLVALSVAPYTLGEAGNLLPPEWKERVFVVSIVAAAILRVLKGVATADASVVGQVAEGVQSVQGTLKDVLKEVDKQQP